VGGRAKQQTHGVRFLEDGYREERGNEFTFNVLKCDKLFDVLLQNNVIMQKGGTPFPRLISWHQESTVSGIILFHI
jgi:hypothetical protein